jgi:16S rRNA (uracil1498-N3)-methyltransferase
MEGAAVPAGRFVVPGELLAAGGEIALPGDVAHQARDVLRLAPGAALTLLDGVGGEWPATLLAVDRAGVTARLGARREGAGEARTRVVLYVGLLKGDKLEWALQKGTELGVAAFVPLRCERAVAGGDEPRAGKRGRWERIVAEATEQCGRAHVPEVAEPQTLARALGELPRGAVALVAWEEERATSLRAALVERWAPGGDQSIALFIGPEGGFAAAEVALAVAHGAVPVTLGPRILRAETAALVAAALALEACGELG